MPELKCANSDDFFVLRDGAVGIFLSASTFPRSRESRAPEVADLKRHRAELDSKFHYLADAPEKDDKGNPVLVRFDRKAREHYLTSGKNGEPTGWTARFADGAWRVHRAEAPSKKKGRSGSKRRSPKKDQEAEA
jgi:DNA topoisomerase-1